jgi:hypothetical protein
MVENGRGSNLRLVLIMHGRVSHSEHHTLREKKRLVK